ncbi:MAG: phosphatase PAP2 family protein [Sebaldella sp.]|nr:phosphatase PAP2 family protein [Sebaldella sp.]
MLNIIDQSFINFISTIHNSILDKIMIIFTSLGDDGIIWIILLLILLGIKKTRKVGFLMLVSVLLALFFNDLLKDVFNRERPYTYLNIVPLVKASRTSSFPSSHTSVAFAVLGVYSYFKLKYKPIIAIMAFGIGFSRIYLNLHYFTDVLAGIGLGLGISYIVIYMYSHILRLTKKRQLRLSEKKVIG